MGRISVPSFSTFSGFTLATKLRDVVGGGRGHDRLRRAGLDDPAALHDRDRVADLERLVEIVADEDDGLVQPLLQLEQIVLQLVADQRVEGGERLVHQQDVGVGGEGAGEPDALLHAAGELVRELAGPLLEVHQRQLLHDDAVALGLGHAAQLQAERRRSRPPCARAAARTAGTPWRPAASAGAATRERCRWRRRPPPRRPRP